MPTKHIDDVTWRKIEQKTVDAVVKTQKSVKATEMMHWLIKKGLEEITDEDYKKYLSK